MGAISVKAMILAAGYGKRMRPLTDKTPKPLLKVNGAPLIEKVIIALRDAGVHDIVINHAWLGQQIVAYCGDGSRFGVSIAYSAESEPLETAGGIARALPLLGDQPFIAVNADVYTDFDFAQLASKKPNKALGHLVLVTNPDHHKQGDFSIRQGLVQAVTEKSDSYTFSGISLLSPMLFHHYHFYEGAIAPLFRLAAADQRLSAEIYHGQWMDVGTPERLKALQASDQ